MARLLIKNYLSLAGRIKPEKPLQTFFGQLRDLSKSRLFFLAAGCVAGFEKRKSQCHVWKTGTLRSDGCKALLGIHFRSVRDDW
jgi:hypothetical protein